MIAPSSAHSAIVTLHLKIDDRTIPLTHLAHDFAIVADVCELPPCNAEIVMSVDGVIDRMLVFLPEGCGGGNRRICVAPRPKR
jgi:hypothetical protein